jgi:cyclophilin family peptidyl-prolyl cis-trans isomerase/HEAT repeat protein
MPPSARFRFAVVAIIVPTAVGCRTVAGDPGAGTSPTAQSADALVDQLNDGAAAGRSHGLLALTRVLGRRAKPATAMEPALASLLRAHLERLLSDADEGVRWRAAYALSEIEIPGRLPLLRKAAGSPDARAQLFALRGLGRLLPAVDDPDDAPPSAGPSLADFMPAVASANPHVAAAALAQLAKLRDPEAIPALVEAAGRRRAASDHHVRLAAAEALTELGARAGPAGLVALHFGLEDPSPRVKAAALTGLVKLNPEGMLPTLRAWSSAEDVYQRLAVPGAAALGGEVGGALLLELAVLAERRVAAVALEALIEMGEGRPPSREVALAASARKDLALRDAALRLLAKVGEPADLDAIRGVFGESPGTENVELRVTAVRAAAELAGKRAMPFLRQAVGDDSAAVAKAAAGEIEGLSGDGAEAPSTGPAPPLARADVPVSAPENPRVVLHTDKGDVELELLPGKAPRHVESFLRLARSGFYNGLTFHRIVTGFVAQGLDPRGDGWGTGGVHLKDELNAVPYLTGAVGMPNAGPDTGGCQIFITHVPTPHLDGRYTLFGRVEGGMAVVDALDLGDRVRAVTIR